MSNKSARIDMVGNIYGYLTVISFNSYVKEDKRTYWNCYCKCNPTKILVKTRKALLKNNPSCGCYSVEILAKRNKNNTYGRKYDNPSIDVSAKTVWEIYKDGLTFDDFLVLSQMDCWYCHKPPSNSFNYYMTKKGKLRNGVTKEWAEISWFNYNGVDRINPLINHMLSNCVPCCKECNLRKSNYILNEFVDNINAILNFSLTKGIK